MQAGSVFRMRILNAAFNSPEGRPELALYELDRRGDQTDGARGYEAYPI